MFKLTKAELIRLIQERNTEIQKLRLDLSIAQLERALVIKHAPKPVAHKPWVRPAHMEAARQLAISTHQVVLL